MKNKCIQIVCGGSSCEREVSLRSGEAVFLALQGLGLNVHKFDLQNGLIGLGENCDVVFLALHGRGGEDGSIQGYLRTKGVPFTGSDILASAICMNKIVTKTILSTHEILMPRSTFFMQNDDLEIFIKTFALNFPVMLKPACEGSTVGIARVVDPKQLYSALLECLKFGDNVLVEEFIEGTELTVGLLNGTSLPVVEICPESGFYDYESKYTLGKTKYYCPARIPDKIAQQMLLTSEKIIKILGCQGAPRVDYILDSQQRTWFLEVNTIPGMTATSLLPMAAKAHGLSFAELCVQIVNAALK